jgi:hypothetical protein
MNNYFINSKLSSLPSISGASSVFTRSGPPAIEQLSLRNQHHEFYEFYYEIHTANEGPVRIQYKCLVFIYVFPKIKLLFSKRIVMFCLQDITLIYLWEIYIFPGLVCIFCCRELCGLILGIYKSLPDAWMWNWDWGGAIPRKGIHKWDFPYSVRFFVCYCVSSYLYWLLLHQRSHFISLHCGLIFQFFVIFLVCCLIWQSQTAPNWFL